MLGLGAAGILLALGALWTLANASLLALCVAAREGDAQLARSARGVMAITVSESGESSWSPPPPARVESLEPAYIGESAAA